MKMEEKIQSIIEKLTVDEKIRLLSGDGSWHTHDAGGKVPKIMMTDGPHGLRKQEADNLADVNNSKLATCFPTASAIASTWNEEAIGKMADAIGREALKEQVSVVLGCGINIKRSPLCGRNFEYFSEDPYLAGRMASAYVKSMQSLGVGTSIKHFAGNNQETRRQTSNSQIDERALREIYLSAFEMVVKEAQPTTIMASYNRLNGEYACANKRLLTDILRKEWGFKGTVISDWGAAVDIEKCVKAGLDLEMPDSSGIHGEKLKKALEEKTLSIADIDRAVKNVVTLAVSQSEKLGNSEVDYDKQHEIARQLECEAAVLLRNQGILPLKKDSDVLVVGELAENMRFQGAGSSHIHTRPIVNALEALRSKGLKVTYAQGYHSNMEKEDTKLEDAAVKLAKEKSIILFFGGLTDQVEGEGFDRSTMKVPVNQRVLLERLYEINPNIVFISFGGSPMEMPFSERVEAILHMYLGGQAVGEACADLLVGDANPSGKLAETFPKRLEDVPSEPNFALDSDDVEYRESLFVGYRYYDTFHVDTLFDFGYGLSYTKFRYENLRVDKDTYEAGPLKLTFTITNTGTMDGSEVAQVYVKNPIGTFLRARRELRGFVKVFLAAGESKEVTVVLNERSFSIYDIEKKDFIMPSGVYEIQVGSALNDIRLNCEMKVQGVPFNRDDRQQLGEYYKILQKGTKAISTEQFEVLFGGKTSHFDEVKKGEFTMYHSFGKTAERSLFGRIVLSSVKKMMMGMVKGKPKDAPEVKMIMQAIQDGPIDGMICQSGGRFPVKLAEAIVIGANNNSFKAIGRMMRKKSI